MNDSSPQLRALPLAHLVERLAPESRLLGLDVSKNVIGLALSDSAYRLATPLTTLVRKNKPAAEVATELLAIIADHNVGGLIVGLPLTEKGESGVRVRSMRGIMRSLVLLGVSCPWAEWDERFSTRAAIGTINPTKKHPQQKPSRKNADAEAATWILQGALDSLQQQSLSIRRD